MSAQYTPGPWRYDYEPGYCGEIIASNGKEVATFTDEPNAPDARMIAAAPDLLDALQASWNPAISSAEREAKARAAISKALGEKI